MESYSKTDELKLTIPDEHNKEFVDVSLSYLRSFLVSNNFKIKDIEYVVVMWQINWDKGIKLSIRKVPYLVLYYNYHSTHR